MIGTRCWQPLSLQCCLWWCAGNAEHIHKLPRGWRSARGWSTPLLMMYFISNDADQFQASFSPFPHLHWTAAGPPEWSVAGLQCVCVCVRVKQTPGGRVTVTPAPLPILLAFSAAKEKHSFPGKKLCRWEIPGGANFESQGQKNCMRVWWRGCPVLQIDFLSCVISRGLEVKWCMLIFTRGKEKKDDICSPGMCKENLRIQSFYILRSTTERKNHSIIQNYCCNNLVSLLI